MKKIKMNVLILIWVICLTGCNSELQLDIMNGGTDIQEGDNSISEIRFADNRISIEEYKTQYTSEIEEIKNGSFDNISFENCEIHPIREIEKVGVYRLYSNTIGVEESIKTIENWLEEIECEDIELEKELRDASGQYKRENGVYPYDYPAVYDYYPELESGQGFFINTNRCYIQMGSDGIYSMSDGSITEYLNLDTLAAMDALGVNSTKIVSSGMVDEKADEIWDLANGKESIASAANFVRQYFEEGTPRKNPIGITVDVPEVEVFVLDEKYGYIFTIRRVYNGVPFAYSTTGARTYYSLDYEIVEDIKRAYVIESDSVAAFTGYIDAELLESIIEEQTDILSLKNATLLLDDFFASNVEFNVDKVELVYCTYKNKDAEKIVYPCWQFEGVNTRNAQAMRVYVNVLSGAVYYYSYVEN